MGSTGYSERFRFGNFEFDPVALKLFSEGRLVKGRAAAAARFRRAPGTEGSGRLPRRGADPRLGRDHVCRVRPELELLYPADPDRPARRGLQTAVPRDPSEAGVPVYRRALGAAVPLAG